MNLPRCIVYFLASTFVILLAFHHGTAQSKIRAVKKIESRVTSSFDDAEERASGSMKLSSTDLELVTDTSVQSIGFRFRDITIPNRARVQSAYIQFQADESDTAKTSLQIQGEASDNAKAFSDSRNNISHRPKTTASVLWSPASWKAEGDSGSDQRTPDLKHLVQEIVSRPGWKSGNSIAMLIHGSGKRTAKSYDGDEENAPRLLIEYTDSLYIDPDKNSAPQVNAGPDRVITGPNPSVTMQGSVTDDGEPNPPALITSVWSQVSGTGTAEFSNVNSLTTTVSFSVSGTYILRLKASDGELQAQDEVLINVQVEQPPPPKLPELPNEPERDTVSDVPVELRRFVDGANGTDSGAGDANGPWRTIKHALSQLRNGETLFLRGGEYNEADLVVFQNGSSSEWTTIRNYPNEKVLINASLPDFRTSDADNWILEDSATGTYKSVSSGYSDDVYTGKVFLDNGDVFSLVPYYDKSGEARGLSDLQSETYTVSSGARYVGPGIYNSNGQLYIRLKMLPPSVLHGYDPDIRVGPNPNNVEIHLSERSTVFDVVGSHIRIIGLTISGAKAGIEIQDGAKHIEVRNVDFNIAGNAVLLRDGASDILVDRSTIHGSFPEWVAWTDMKGSSDGQSRPASYSRFKESGINGNFVHNVTISNNEFKNVFDGMVIEGGNLSIYNNSGFFRDDMIQLGSNSYDVEIHKNQINGAGPSHSGKGDSPKPGSIYIHHNVIDSTPAILWGKRDPSDILRKSYKNWHANRPFPSHSSSGLDSGDPWKIYSNTILFDGSTSSKGVGFQLWDQQNETSEAHEVYNNIFIEVGGGSFATEISLSAGPQIYDGNIYWRENGPSSEPLFESYVGLSGAKDYHTLADFLNSSDFLDTAELYVNGWEANGSEADPQLRPDLHPIPGGLAAFGAVPIPDIFPGERQSHRGALAPK